MNEFTKWIWIVFILFLWLGWYVFALAAIIGITLGLVAWLKPQWMESENKMGAVFFGVIVITILILLLVSPDTLTEIITGKKR